MRIAPALAISIVLLAGCTSSPDVAPNDGGVIVVDSPFNRTADQNAGPHLHDYWGGAHRLTIADTDVLAPGYLWFGDTSISVATLRPDPGHVVPQGTGWVNVTVSWTDDPQAIPPNTYTNVQLVVKTAGDNVGRVRANLTSSPTTVSLPTNLTDADLPHQVLSAWQFDLFMAPTYVAGGTPAQQPEAAFTGNVHFLVTADRTLPIPLFPGHPDQWQNRTEIKMFSASGHLFYDGDPTTNNWRCYGGCPIVYHPDDKVVVPIDANHVVIKLGLSGTSPTKLGIKYHGADSRTFAKAVVGQDTTTMRTYTVDVGIAGDGPYAKQSQWEIVPYIEGPKEDGLAYEDYTIEATAYLHV
ncbi:MAG: hypothetical protein V4510_11615 [bacterium]